MGWRDCFTTTTMHAIYHPYLWQKCLHYGEMLDRMTRFRYGISSTMLIGLISDTHIPDHAKELPPQLKEVFHGVDLILHAGDVYDVSVLDELECLAPILVADGDDDFEVRSDRRVKKEHILTVEGVTIWLKHKRPHKWDVDKKCHDVIVFGHTHKAYLDNLNGVLQVNPGSATYPLYKSELGTVGLLTANSGKAEAQIIQLQ